MFFNIFFGPSCPDQLDCSLKYSTINSKVLTHVPEVDGGDRLFPKRKSFATRIFGVRNCRRTFHLVQLKRSIRSQANVANPTGTEPDGRNGCGCFRARGWATRWAAPSPCASSASRNATRSAASPWTTTRPTPPSPAPAASASPRSPNDSRTLRSVNPPVN